MSFHDVRFPDDIAYGSSGGPGFNTTVLELESGHEKRNQNWSRARARYDIKTGIKEHAQMQEVANFFYARRGRAYGFRFKDWRDYSVGPTDLGIGDGVNTIFQMIKVYESGGIAYTREISKPVAGTFKGLIVGTDAVDPADLQIDYDTGLITLATAPDVEAVVTMIGVEFDVPVRFDIDHLDVVHEAWEAENVPSIPLVEVRI